MPNSAILSQAQVQGRIRRLALQVLEANVGATRICLLGIAGQGAALAEALAAELKPELGDQLEFGTITLNKREPWLEPQIDGLDRTVLDLATVVLVDDVLNTGRTLAYAFASLMGYRPLRVQVAVLVARNHALYPLKPDFVGHSLSTTLEEHIEVRMGEGVYLH